MAGAVAIEAARRLFLASGHCLGPQNPENPESAKSPENPESAQGGVRAEILASWRRSRRHDVDPDRLAARFAGNPAAPSLATACAEEVFDEFFKLNRAAEASLILADAAGVIRVRRDGEDSLARLLDTVPLVPGYGRAARGRPPAGITRRTCGARPACGRFTRRRGSARTRT